MSESESKNFEIQPAGRKWKWKVMTESEIEERKNLSESESNFFDIQPAGRRLRNIPSMKEQLPGVSYQKYSLGWWQ